MATDVNQAFFAWPQDESVERDGSQGVSVSQMLNHGSISFGRFEYESLSWEKRSVFTHDRRQEELEQFNGLVAEKKAYFEEYYRRMRALKALQQQQQLQNLQTELILEYSSDGGDSSQTEEDETAARHGNLRETAEIVHGSVEQDAAESIFEQQTKFHKDSENQISNSEFSSSRIPSSAGGHTQFHKDSENRKSNSEISSRISSSAGGFEQTEQEIRVNDGGCKVANEMKGVQHNDNPDQEIGVVHETKEVPKKSTDKGPKLRPSTPNKVKPPPKKPLDRMTLSKVLSGAAKSGPSSILKTKPGNARSSAQPKPPPPPPPSKIIPKADISKRVTKGTSGVTPSLVRGLTSGVISATRPSSVASRRNTTEKRADVSIPRRPTTADRNAANRQSIVKTNQKLPSGVGAPPAHQKKGPTVQPVQGTMKETAALSSIRIIKPETTRQSKGFSKDPSSDKQSTSIKRMELHVLGKPKSSSVNFPPKKSSDSNGGEKRQMETLTRQKNKVENPGTVRPRAATPTARRVAPSHIETPKSRIEKQPPPLQMRRPSSAQSRRPVTDVPLNGRKPKIEARHWH